MQTTRQEIVELITYHPLDVHNIAVILGTTERQIKNELGHVLKSYKEQIKIYPAACNKCEFIFTNQRFKKPGRCPKCKSTWISAPRIEICPL